VRAHAAARDAGIRSLVGCRIELGENATPDYLRPSLLLYPTNREGYGILCRLLTEGRARVKKNEFCYTIEEFLKYQNYFVTVIVPPFFQSRLHLEHQWHNESSLHIYTICEKLKENAKDKHLLSLAVTQSYGPLNQRFIRETLQVSRSLEIPVVATNDVYYHVPERRPLQDVLTCIREGCTVQQGGLRLLANGERYLKPPHEVVRLFRELPWAISRTLEIAEQCSSFSLDQVKYHYPLEIYPKGSSPEKYLREQVFLGAARRYPEIIPDTVLSQIEDELILIRELDYEKYFLTCYDIVTFARNQGILCQGRGAAANSVVCYCLGITSVDPTKVDLLFARFVSKERKEPPDIDIDFEHERREEVIQYIYKKYGRDRAAIASEVVTYRPRSAIREVGKVLGLSLQVVDALAKNVHRWTGYSITADLLRELGVDPFDTTIQNSLLLANEIVGFPRHLSQHVGGFIISEEPLCEIVPIINAGMEGRTIIEWDKNDIEELGMLKIDILALGMLTCIRKALDLINQRNPGQDLKFHTIPPEVPEVYAMLQRSDSVGVFQVESRAQMSMLPRLKPKCFYDLVIEVAIVRPGPIQGNMIHPYLKRRNGLEHPYYPDKRVEKILGKTLGVPIFQEQAMRLAIVLAQFTPDEAERLRRAMAAWKHNKGAIETFKEKIIRGMTQNGYSSEFAEICLHQIKGFSEYGFPESHAASFALLVYASAWLKRFYPSEFYCALLNSQPMGFYSPSQIIQDARRHQISVKEIDVKYSRWDCTLEYSEKERFPIIRLGLRLIAGLRCDDGENIISAIENNPHIASLNEIQSEVSSKIKRGLKKLAAADSFNSLTFQRRRALWELQALPELPTPMDRFFKADERKSIPLPETTLQQEMFNDYRSTGLSLRAHPLQFVRERLKRRGAYTTDDLSVHNGIKVGSLVQTAGIASVKQRPGTAKGVVFITLEDEFGTLNLIIRPQIFERFQKEILQSSTLLVRGRLERIGEVIYVDTHEIRSFDTETFSSQTIRYSVKSYSY
jgi:error-prone DNA polymerase